MSDLSTVEVSALQEQSAIINLIVYTGYENPDPNTDITIGDIIKKVDPDKLDSALAEKWHIVKSYAENNPNFKELQLVDHSINAPKDTTGETYDPDAFFAMTFYDPNNEQYTVAYRGTPNHAWVENANAFGPARDNTYYTYDMNGVASETVVHEHASASQAAALNYMNYIKSKRGLTKDDFIITTGHSQGDNNAKTVAIKSDLEIDLCFGFDGPGYSPEALEELSQYPNFEQQRSRIYQLRANNNIIDAFSFRKELAHQENITYVKGNFSRGILWPIDHMHSIFNDSYEEGGSVFNEQVSGRGPLSNFAASYSEILLLLPPEGRATVGRGVMQLVQLALGHGGESGFDDPAQLWEVCSAILVSMTIFPASAIGMVAKTFDIKEDAATLFLTSLCVAGFFCMFPTVAVSVLATGAFVFVTGVSAAPWIALVGLISYAEDQIKQRGFGFQELTAKLLTLMGDLSMKLQIHLDQYCNAPGYQYAAENPYIQVSTAKLREASQHATRLYKRLKEGEKDLKWLNREAMLTTTL
ncbi:MAG: DUF2974 domain-containing protein, partial [Peptococcaceae bacterium]|nr:DUF2974 domain-containing protein [Peptococcaceae bacterium]